MKVSRDRRAMKAQLLLPMVGVVVLASLSHGATITWTGGTFTETTLPGVLPQPGHVVYAENYGGNAATVNGVAFAAAKRTTMGTSSGPTGLTKSLYHYGDSDYMEDSPRTVGALSDPEMQTVLSTSLRQPGWWASSARIQLRSLQPTVKYRVLVLFADTGVTAQTQARAGATGSGNVPNLGSNTTIVAAPGILGGYLAGTFVADATTQSFDVTVVKPPYPNWFSGSQSYNLNNFVNAVAVSEVRSAGTVVMLQ